MGKDTFFFEEDPVAEDSGITAKEHADTFFSALETEGIIKDRQGISSFDQLKNEAAQSTEKKRNALVEVEFGVVNDDYVLHVTPTHPHKNLQKRQLFEVAVRECVILLNQVVPTTLTVDIYLPQPDWEIKATSFIIRGGADAWNLDVQKIASETVPLILERVAKICAQA